MRSLKNLGVLAALVLAMVGGRAVAAAFGNLTWKGSASILADSGSAGQSDALAMSTSSNVGIACTLPTVPNGSYDTVQFQATCSNDAINWFPCPGIPDAGYVVTDAGQSTQMAVNIPPLPFGYIGVSIALAGAANASTVNCSTARP